MKKFAALGVMIALMSLLLVGAPAAVADPGNLLANPGFETGNNSGWGMGGTATRGVAIDGATPASDGTSAIAQVRTGNYGGTSHPPAPWWGRSRPRW